MRGLALVFISLLIIPVAAEDALPGPTAIRRMTSELLRDESAGQTPEARSEAIVALCDLFAAIHLHPMYSQSEILQGEATRVRRRLLSVGRQWSERLERAGTARPSELRSRVDATLAMSPSDMANTARSEWPGGAGPGAAANDGWELIELIQRTVHPEFWEDRGGPGAIRYFAIKRVLVVRATTQVHEDLAALLGQL